MYQVLRKGEKLHTSETKQEIIIESLIGGGGQGEVYKASLFGKNLAIKWYFEHTATSEQKNILLQLIKTGKPSEKFLWPQELVLSTNHKEFGYMMELRDPKFKNVNELLNRTIDPPFSILLIVGFYLADEFSKLHSKGYCYRDISSNNVFFDPSNGDIKICDNDNVVINNRGEISISGTPRFMAPEIVLGESAPNISTDEFSLAILLFYLLLIHHPLEGKLESDIHSFDGPAMRYLYGENPVFIFDPDNHSNLPVPNLHDNATVFWNIYPQKLREQFTEAFTKGIRGKRIPATYWRSILLQVKDLIFYCGECAKENFFDPATRNDYEAQNKLCWNCNKPLSAPSILKIGRHLIALNADTKLYSYHFNIFTKKLYDFSTPLAEVVQHPNNPELWGLKNISDFQWTLDESDRTSKSINPGNSILIDSKKKINFKYARGEFF